jgi:hypothetical protein
MKMKRQPTLAGFPSQTVVPDEGGIKKNHGAHAPGHDTQGLRLEARTEEAELCSEQAELRNEESEIRRIHHSGKDA